MLCCYQAIRTLISHAADGARISFTRARRRNPQPHQRLRILPADGLAEEAADLAVEITCRQNLVPNAPAAATSARPSPRRPVQDPQTRRDHPADPADQDDLLAAARAELKLMPLGPGRPGCPIPKCWPGSLPRSKHRAAARSAVASRQFIGGISGRQGPNPTRCEPAEGKFRTLRNNR